MEILIGADGTPIQCHCIGGNAWFHAGVWTREEAESYIQTGRYPQRLLDKIRKDFEEYCSKQGAIHAL